MNYQKLTLKKPMEKNQMTNQERIKKSVDDSFIFITTAQFLLDFAEENIVPKQWATTKLKSSLKTTISLIQERINVLFGFKADKKALAQHFNASIIMENNMKLVLYLATLEKEKAKKFENDYMELLKKYGADKLEYRDLDSTGIDK